MRNLVPDTDSRRSLDAWRGKPGNTLVLLAKLTGIPDATLGSYVDRLARPPEWRRELIEEATKGFVPAAGWRTREEVAAVARARAKVEREGARRQARKAG